MTAALLVFVLWLWDPVTTACDNTSERIDHYEMQQTTAFPVDAWCVDDLGQTFWCGNYLFYDWIVVAQTPDATPILEYEPPVPVPGNVIFNRIIAVDTGGNTSEQACP